MPDSFYSDASVYDILHAPGTAAEVTGLERIERRFVGHARGSWLEPACGTARYLRVAARRGRRVIGFDASEGMLAYARTRFERLGADVARRATLFVADMEGFDRAVASPFRAMGGQDGRARRQQRPEAEAAQPRRIGRQPRVTFAFNLINTFRHLESDAAALAHLRAMRRVLMRDGAPGIYAMGISMSGYGAEFPSEDVWEARRGKVFVRQVAQYDPPRSRRRRWEQVHNIVVIQRPGREDELQASSYRLRTYDRRQFEALVMEAGFEVAGHVDEQGRDAPVIEPGYGIWILRA